MVGFDDRRPVGEGFRDDGADEHGERDPPERAPDGVRVLELSPRLVQGKEAATLNSTIETMNA